MTWQKGSSLRQKVRYPNICHLLATSHTWESWGVTSWAFLGRAAAISRQFLKEGTVVSCWQPIFTAPGERGHLPTQKTVSVFLHEVGLMIAALSYACQN